MNPIRSIDKEVEISKTVEAGLSTEMQGYEGKVLDNFDGATPMDWDDWKWQLANRIKTKDALKKIVDLTEDEELGVDNACEKLAMTITPYFLSLIDPHDPDCPIRKQCIPQKYELDISKEEMADPCAEERNSPVHGLVHRYPDRVLFLVSEMCAMYCRFCTRSRLVGEGRRSLTTETYEKAFEYIRSNKNVRDVLISGGDPLTLSDSMLEYILKNLKSIKHVEFVRIGTRVPVTLPQRVTKELAQMLKQYSPVWMSVHFNHPKEITPRVENACNILSDHGIPLGSQTVLLKGINDTPETMKTLMHDLLKIRVRPYYIYQCDPITGSKHFRTPVSTGVNIIKQLRGFTSGYAVPTFVIDAPGGGGKIPVGPEYITSIEDGKYKLDNYAGDQYTHYDPQ